MKAPSLSRFRALIILLFRLNRPIAGLLRASIRLGDIFWIPLLKEPLVFVNDPLSVERIFQTDSDKFKKSFEYEAMRRLFGNGLLTREGEGWKEDRREIQSHFKPSFFEQFDIHLKEEVEHSFREVNTGKHFDALQLNAHLTMKLILRKLIGRSMADDEARSLIREFDTAQKALTKLVFKSLGIPQPFSHAEKKMERANQVIRNFVREELESATIGEEDPKSLLSLFQKSASKRMGDPNERESWIVDQFLTFFSAGYDTTALTLTWLLRVLALNPAVQEKCRGNPEYRLAVIQETLRLYPVISMISRENSVDVELGGFHFPAGTTFLTSPEALQLSPKLWKDPLIFRPERFLSGEESRQSLKNKYIPFGAGPRVCIGQGFALMEMEEYLRHLSDHYRVIPQNPHALDKIYGITLVTVRPSARVILRLVPHR